MTEDLLFDANDIEELETEAKPRRKKKKKAVVASAGGAGLADLVAKPITKFDPSDIEPIAQGALIKLPAIMTEMAGKLFEREEVIRDLFLAMIAGENILLLGPPGTGKTMLAETLHRHIDDTHMFKWLMNRTTDPADVIGPYSITGMENDEFYRVIKGKAADAELFFVDEIFKANEPVLNFMLSMLNEGYVYNNGVQHEVPLRLTIAASNEFPENEDLEAFYDRFIFRHWVNYIQDAQNRINMAAAARNRKGSALPPTQITVEEIDALQKYVHEVKFPTQMEKTYDRLIRSLGKDGMTVSDRRYYKGQKVMMAHALLSGRDTVTGSDLIALKYVLWNKDVKEIEHIETELLKYVNPHESKLKDLLKKAEQVMESTLAIEQRTQRAGEAVTANATIKDILGKMEDEIDVAERNGQDIKQYKKFVDSVEAIMQKIADECLRSQSTSRRDWSK